MLTSHRSSIRSSSSVTITIDITWGISIPHVFESKMTLATPGVPSLLYSPLGHREDTPVACSASVAVIFSAPAPQLKERVWHEPARVL